MSELGRELSEHNHQIVNCISELHQQRDELDMLIKLQKEEKLKLESEIERISYKLGVVSTNISFATYFHCIQTLQIAKSLTQRQKAKAMYDQTIEEAEKKYQELVLTSGALMNAVTENVDILPQNMDKKIGTSIDEGIRPLVKQPGKDKKKKGADGTKEKKKHSKKKRRSQTTSDEDGDGSDDTGKFSIYGSKKGATADGNLLQNMDSVPFSPEYCKKRS